MVLSLTDHSAWASVRQARYNLRAVSRSRCHARVASPYGKQMVSPPFKKTSSKHFARAKALAVSMSVFFLSRYHVVLHSSCAVSLYSTARLHDVRLEPSAIFELSMMSGLMMFTTLERSFLACAEQHKPSSF
jgi:hypothetical protein